MKKVTACTLVFVFLSAFPAIGKDREISGKIVGIDCGDATSLTIKTSGGKRVTGTCFEPWCDEICSSSQAKKRLFGRHVSARSKVTNMEEPSEGVLVNQFHSVVLD